MTQVEGARALHGSIPVEEAHQSGGGRRDRACTRSDSGNRAAPHGGDGSTGAAGGVGGYNAFLIDSGKAFTIIDGRTRRSSILDRRVSALTAPARARQAAARNQPTSDQAASGGDVGLETAAGAYDDP